MRFNLLFIFLFSFLGSFSQEFSVIELNTSARISALGGSANAIIDDDVTLGQVTPSLLNPLMDNVLVLSAVDYLADINVVSASFAKYFSNLGTVSFGVNAIEYGDFTHRDATGNSLGSFSANDQIITCGIARGLNRYFRLGINFSILNSRYEQYHSTAISSNISTTYHNVKKDLTISILAKNIGRQLDVYSSKHEAIPFELQFGVSKVLMYLPFRYSIVFRRLTQFNTNYSSSTHDESIAKTVLKHVVIGGEFFPFRENIFLRGGLNLQRRFDMTIPSRPAMIGFSCGIGLKISKFQIDYSRSAYHLSGHTNNFSITTNLAKFGLFNGNSN
ncbi:MAG: type IX secretion system protein PorQ [Bacteroidota bacterium]|nr:type IX secretion system protein PorQ [Bacteroidota bacterium]